MENLTKDVEKNNVKTSQQITIQEIQALYFDKDIIRESGVSLRRLDYSGHRNYYTITENNTLDSLYTSVTTFTKSVMPTSTYLLQWMKNKSEEEQSYILKSSSTYGTLMDILFNQLIISGELKDIEKQVWEFTMTEGLYTIDQTKWTEQLKKDCLSFAQFVRDYEVKPILVSCPLKSDRLGIAGTLDLLCEMNKKILTKTDIKKGVENERINCIIDYKAKIGDMSMKSDRNSFWDSECLQLELYERLVFDTFPDITIQGLCNFSPKNWRANPDYNLKSWYDTQTHNRIKGKFDKYHDIWKIDNADIERSFIVIDDLITLHGYESQFRTISLTDFINQNLQESEYDRANS